METSDGVIKMGKKAVKKSEANGSKIRKAKKIRAERRTKQW